MPVHSFHWLAVINFSKPILLNGSSFTMENLMEPSENFTPIVLVGIKWSGGKIASIGKEFFFAGKKKSNRR